ncbi:hypothetical protein MRX96_049484 [Rhipicephalus microplus]
MDEQKNGRMKSLQQRIDQFLFNYRNTPTGVTEETPAQLFLSWKPRTRLSFLHPDIEQRMKEKLERTRQAANRRRGAWRDFEEGEDVLVQGLRPGEGEWLSGVFPAFGSGAVCKLRTSRMHPRRCASQVFRCPLYPSRAHERRPTPIKSRSRQKIQTKNRSTYRALHLLVGTAAGGETQSSPPELPELRRSTRQRRPPDRY